MTTMAFQTKSSDSQTDTDLSQTFPDIPIINTISDNNTDKGINDNQGMTAANGTARRYVRAVPLHHPRLKRQLIFKNMQYRQTTQQVTRKGKYLFNTDSAN